MEHKQKGSYIQAVNIPEFDCTGVAYYSWQRASGWVAIQTTISQDKFPRRFCTLENRFVADGLNKAFRNNEGDWMGWELIEGCAEYHPNMIGVHCLSLRVTTSSRGRWCLFLCPGSQQRTRIDMLTYYWNSRSVKSTIGHKFVRSVDQQEICWLSPLQSKISVIPTMPPFQCCCLWTFRFFEASS